MDNISNHITYLEATNSITAKRNNIINTPNVSQLNNMRQLAEKVFEPLREGLGNIPINIAIFFRSELLNTKVGGANGSQHMALKGAAIDLDNDGYMDRASNKSIFEYIKNNLKFDQLIAESKGPSGPGWVHVSYNEGTNRNQVLIAKYSNKGKMQYFPYSEKLFKEIYG